MPARSTPEITVRMYKMGFGDCFLVRIPSKQGRDRRILIDCGVHASGPGEHPVDEVIDRILSDIRDEPDGEPVLDVVVATHRHQDHVSGFADDRWAEVAVEEVWMPWTEDPDSGEAMALRERQLEFKRRLTLSLVDRPKDDPASRLALELTGNLAASNDRAMETLHSGFKGRERGGDSLRRFLPHGPRNERSFTSPCLPGVKIHVLGPSLDPDIVTLMNPPEGQHYFTVTGAGSGAAGDRDPPFDDRFTCPSDKLRPELQSLLDRDEMGLLKEMGDDCEGLAAAFDRAVNNTSLVLLLQIGRVFMLFCGDAQWGTWKEALDDREWQRLLRKTRLLKVGHHGSHNASPVDLIERALQPEEDPELPRFALVPVRPVERWKNIPRKPLLDRLKELKWTVVRSDGEDNVRAPGVKTSKDGLYIDVRIPI